MPSCIKSCKMLNIATSSWIWQLKLRDNIVFLTLSASHSHSRCSFWILVPVYCFRMSEVVCFLGFFFNVFINKTVLQGGSLSLYCKKPHLFPRSESCRIRLIRSAVNQAQSICTVLRKSKMQHIYRRQTAWPFPAPNPSILPRTEPMLSWRIWGLPIFSTRTETVSKTGTWCDLSPENRLEPSFTVLMHLNSLIFLLFQHTDPVLRDQCRW